MVVKDNWNENGVKASLLRGLWINDFENQIITFYGLSRTYSRLQYVAKKGKGFEKAQGRFTKNRPYTPPKKRNEATFSAPQLLISVNCIDGLAFNYELIFDNIFGKVQAWDIYY